MDQAGHLAKKKKKTFIDMESNVHLIPKLLMAGED